MLTRKPKYYYLYSKRLVSSSLPPPTPTTNRNNYLPSFTRLLTDPIADLQTLLQSHTLTITSGHANNIFIAAKLISLYSSFNLPDLSSLVFHSVHPKDTFLWNSVIKSHFSNALHAHTLRFFQQMRGCDCVPNAFTLPMVVGSCSELLIVEWGRCVHALGLKVGCFEGNSAVGGSFVYMYSKCGQMMDACRVFDEMLLRDVVAWTALVVGCVQNGENELGLGYFCEMHRVDEQGEKPNFRTIESGLQACGNLGDVLNGRCLHGYALKTGNGCSQFVQSSLLLMYSKCGSSEEAYLAFCELSVKDIISWTVVIGVYARGGLVSTCVELFSEMQVSGVYPDGRVISCMLSCFGNAGRIYESKAFHGLIIRRNYQVDEMVSNSLLLMHCKCGSFNLAEKLFARLCECDVDSWNNVIYGYSKAGMSIKCLDMFREMQHLGVKSNVSTLVLGISSCSQLAALHLGRSAHCYAIKSRTDENISIINSLVGMYGRLGNLGCAQKVFNRAERDIVTWNTLMSAYTHNELSREALYLFDQMLLLKLEPNSVTLVIVLSACSKLADLERGKRVHRYIKSMSLGCDISVSTALIDMYIKCGQLKISKEIFDSLPEKDIVLWNVMVSGYGIHGDAKSAVNFFQQMEASDVQPNALSFLAVLSACNHAGLVDEGKYLFNKMRDYSIMPTLKHYACIVDLLGRSGNLHDAESMVHSMPIDPDGGMWGALLAACKLHNNVEIGERVAKRAIESDPENDGYYIILSNLYSSLGKWEEAEKVRRLMTDSGVRKKAGWSAV